MAGAALLVGLVAPAGAAAQERDVTGTWVGTLDVGAARLRIEFEIARDSGGDHTARMASPDQGARDIPVARVITEGDSLRLEVPSVGGVYAGRITESGDTIEGVWTQGAAAWPLRLARGAAEAPRRPQEPQPPFPYEVTEVRVPNDSAPGVTLAGTLTRPSGPGPFAAVVLVSGSGPQDRDESLLGHKPFLVLADHLTRQGIAVLRYDDRGVAESTGDFNTATSEDFASDALAIVRYLRGVPEIDPERIGIIGHSEGGLIAPMAANRSTSVSFIVLLAGPGLTGEEILILQQELILRANGATPEALASARATQARLFEVLREERDVEKARARIEALILESLDSMTSEERRQAGIDAAGGEEVVARAQAAQVTTPWFRFFLFHDPAPVLRDVDVPVLALFGERDLQVPAEQNAAAVRAALDAGGNRARTIEILPGLNHLFQEAETGSPNEYQQIEQTFSETALNRISAWILERFGG